MFKHKIIKYLFIFLISIFLFLCLIISRLAYKPLDITYLSNHLPKVDEYLSEIDNIEAEKVLLDLDLINNEIILRLKKVKSKRNISNISNLIANQIKISLKTTDFIKNRITIKNLLIKNGGFDVHNSNIFEIGKEKKSMHVLNRLAFADISLEKININFYKDGKKIAVISNFYGDLISNNEGIMLSKLKTEKISYKNFNKNEFVTLNNIKLTEKSENNYTINVQSIRIKNKSGFLKNEYLKNVKDFMLEDVSLEFNKHKETLNAYGKILYDNYKNSFRAEGKLQKFTNFNGKININLNNYPILSFIKLDSIKNKNYNIENDTEMFFVGETIINISNNIVEKASMKVNGRDNGKNIFFVNNSNGTKLSIKDIFLDLEYKKSSFEIKKLNINHNIEDINIIGFFNTNQNIFETNIKVKKFDYNKIFRLSKNFINLNNKNLKSINKLEADSIENLEVTLINKNKRIIIDALNCELDNIKIETNKKLILKSPYAKIKKKLEVTEFESKNLKVFNSKGEAIFSNFKMIANNFENRSTKFIINSTVKTNYKFFKNLLEDSKLEQGFIDDLNGELEGKLNVKTNTKDNTIIYDFKGNLENFNYKSANNKFPLDLKDFTGSISLSNSLINITGEGKINNSEAKISLLVDENSLMKMNIISEATPESFDFLGDFNFINKGNTKIILDISKKINSDFWTVAFDANLFSNVVNINYINYTKKKNKRGNVSGTFSFKKNQLISVKKLNFFTEELLINTDLTFEKKLKIKEIKINRFIRDRNDFKGKIKVIDIDSRIISLEGESIDVKQLLEANNKKYKNLSLFLNINNLHYDEVNLGKTLIESEFQNSQLYSLVGNISHNNKKYVNFKKIPQEDNKYKRVKVNFEDFGAFLNNTKISKSFLDGKAEFLFNIKNYSLISGEANIEQSSIKNNSFLARLLQLASFTGLLEILTSEGIPFDRIDLKFFKEDDQIILNEAKFQGFSLGGKLSGTINLNTKKINLEGVIIPAYAINYLLNKIPLIGQVITGIEGEGLIGVNFKAMGSIDEPNYTINPLSILTPGIIRSIFDSLFDDNNEKKTM